MKITIGPISNPADRVTLVDGWATNNPHISQFKGDVYGLEENGLDGWFDSIKPRVDITERPGDDGAYWPARSLLSPRILTIRGFMYRSWGASVLDVARFRDRLNAWLTQPLEIVVDADNGLRRVTGVLSDQIIQHVSRLDRYVRFSLIVTCPDPLKYGPEVTFTSRTLPTLLASNKYRVDVRAVNQGAAPTWPVFHLPVGTQEYWVTNPHGGQVSWKSGTSPASSVTIDTVDSLPLNPSGRITGTITTDTLTALPPGETIYTITWVTDMPLKDLDKYGSIRVSVAPAWY